MKKLFLAFIFALTCSISLHTANAQGGDADNSKPVAHFLEQLDQRLGQVESRLSSLESKLDEGAVKKTIQQEEHPPTKDSEYQRGVTEYVYMLETRTPNLQVSGEYLKNRVCQVSPDMCDHLVQNSYAVYLGYSSVVTLKFLKDAKVSSSLTLNGSPKNYKTGKTGQFNFSNANRLLADGSAQIVLPRY